MASISSSMAHEEEASHSLPTFKTLVSHLLAAKRSLGCVEYVSRANSLVTNTRQVLEEHTIQNARAEFLHAGSLAQAQVLQQIQQHTHGVFQESVTEYAEMIANFEQAEARLNGTLEQLRATIVERALRPKEEEPKSLADFIDETGVDQLKSAVHASIASFGVARQEFERSTGDFDEDVTEARELLTADKSSSAASGLGESSRTSSPLPGLLQRMEEHAQEMASNLESLVKHFDLCITAMQQTERDEGAWRALGEELPEGLRAQLEGSGIVEPLTAEERQEMLEVVQKDAGEVEDVEAEIRHGLAEMEADHEAVERASEMLSARGARTARALRVLDELGSKLAGYVLLAQRFSESFETERAIIAERTREASELRAFYLAFLGGYDRLLIEVGRRQDTKRRIEQIASEALARIDAIRAEEDTERAAFRQLQGDFLPVDLWAGLMSSPARWRFALVDGAEDSVPDISASTINRAIRGLERGHRGSIGGGGASASGVK